MTPARLGLRRYAALGDSFTAGLADDRHPAWPELLAEELTRECPALAYSNLGVVGATAEQVVEQQLPAAIELEPDLVTLVCGLNDVFWSLHPDQEAFRELLVASLGQLWQLSPRPLVVLATLADVTAYIPFRPRSRARVARAISEFNRVVREVAERHGCALVDVERSPCLSDPTSFQPDGIHATREGHTRMAEAALEAIRRAERRWARQAALRQTTALCPPKPNEFESPTAGRRWPLPVTVNGRASPGT